MPLKFLKSIAGSLPGSTISPSRCWGSARHRSMDWESAFLVTLCREGYQEFKRQKPNVFMLGDFLLASRPSPKKLEDKLSSAPAKSHRIKEHWDLLLKLLKLRHSKTLQWSKARSHAGTLQVSAKLRTRTWLSRKSVRYRFLEFKRQNPNETS